LTVIELDDSPNVVWGLKSSSLAIAFAAIVFGVPVETTAAGRISSPQRLVGCWSQISPYPAREIPADRREWGSRTWCFRPRGLLETFNMACGKNGGCDGWDGRWHYRWRGAKVEIEDFDYDVKGGRTQIQRRCLPVFANDDHFVLANCEMSPDEFVKERE
jgi:hypothetical protein